MFKIAITTMAALSIAACATARDGATASAAPTALDPPGARSPAALRSALDERVPAWLAEHQVPSAAIAYLEDGEIAFTALYGEQAPGVPATSRTLYNIASLTKPVVAETILRLAADGRIDLDAPMAPLFVDPDLADDPRAQTLTPAMALSHRLGFAENWRELMEGERLAISWEPGTRAFYSGEGYVYAGHYAEAVTGTPLEDLVRETLFDPLGMADSWLTPSEEWEGRVAMVRGRDGTLRLPDNSVEASAADDMHVTIGDYARFVRSAMQGEGLTPELLEARRTIYDDQVEQACPEGIIPAELCPRHAGFGLGWQVYDSGDNRFLVHSGKDWGERTIALFEPDKRYGVVVFTSGANGRSVISEVLQALVPDERLNTLVAAEARFDR